MDVPTQTKPADDALLVSFADSVRDLTDVWVSMLWLSTTNQRVIKTRREIAAWAREVNKECMQRFGKATASEEIRVILENVVACVPHRLDEESASFIAQAADSGRALAAEGVEAVAAV